MLFYTDIRSLDADQLEFRRRALRSAVLCIGWLKLVSKSLCYYHCCGTKIALLTL